MTYALGIDLGTTFTAAAVWRDGRAEVAPLGSRAAAVPSVVLLRPDETVLTGEAASRRALTEPQRVAREFKRRLGDTTPILLGGVPYSAESLMARLLRAVVDDVAAREGGMPRTIVVSHPANWGPYKTDLLRQAVRIADLDLPVQLITEPEAAAVFYAHQQRLPPGAIVAVYDLGGGTFDAAVLHKTDGGFELLGQPEGIERLGGIDIDAAVFEHVAQALGGRLDELDDTDPAAIAAVGRLREECIDAKEALSADTDVSIAVLLPNVSTEVRLTRSELEAMVRPALHDTIEALRRALRSANVTADQLHSVLLVGGSSRMPIVAQLVGAELGRPVAVDAHPKHAVALGAAWVASGASLPADTPADAAQAERAPADAAPMGTVPDHTPPVTVESPAPVLAPLAPPAMPAAAPAPVPGGRRRTGRGALIGATIAAAVVIGAGAVVAMTGDGGVTGSPAPTADAPGSGSAPAPATDPATSPPQGSEPLVTEAPTTLTATAAPTTVPAAASTTTLPPDEQCTPEIQANDRWVCLTSATIADGQLVVEYVASFAGASPNVNGGYHLHIYGGDGVTPPADIMGTHSPTPGAWYIEDQPTSVRAVSSSDFVNAIGDAPKVCARIAKSGHALVPDRFGGFATGNCVPLVRAG